MEYDPHDKVDEQTGNMTFDCSNRIYKLERDVFATKGISLDEIKSFEVYCELITTYRVEIRTAFHAMIKNKRPTSVESKFTRSLILGEEDEVECLDALLADMKKSNLSEIK